VNSAVPGVLGTPAFIATSTLNLLEHIMRKTHFQQTAQAAAVKPARKAATKPVENTTFTEVKPTTVEPQTEDAYYTRMMNGVNEYFESKGMPSWRRQIMSFMLGLISYGATFYLGMMLVDMMALAAIAYTGVGFIAFMTVFIGFMLSLIASSTVGIAVYNAAMKFEFSNVKARVSSWFTFGNKEIQHA
jgi:hypothetical protein